MQPKMMTILYNLVMYMMKGAESLEEEGWRRRGMVRVKKFLSPFQEKNYVSAPKYLIFPIPDEQIAVNPDLTQNPGY